MSNGKTKLSSLSELRELKLPPALPAAPAVPAPKERAKSVFAKTKPEYLAKLFDKLNNREEVARLCGVTGPTVSTALRTGVVSMPLELAAMGIWLRDHEPKAPALKLADLVIVTIALHKTAWDAVQPWLDEAGAICNELRV